jgi:hypothetical protein
MLLPPARLECSAVFIEVSRRSPTGLVAPYEEEAPSCLDTETLLLTSGTSSPNRLCSALCAARGMRRSEIANAPFVPRWLTSEVCLRGTACRLCAYRVVSAMDQSSFSRIRRYPAPDQCSSMRLCAHSSGSGLPAAMSNRWMWYLSSKRRRTSHGVSGDNMVFTSAFR